MSLKQRSSFVLFMHRFVPVLTVLLAVFSIFVLNLRSNPVAEAATNSTVNFQARLQSASGAIVPDGNYNIEFKLYGASSGGTALWTEDHYNSGSNGLRTVNGYFSTKLGSVTAFPSTINWDQELWLTMNVGGTTTGTPTLDGEMNPRLKLTAVPYAISAGQLQTTNGSYTSKLGIQAPSGGSQVFQIQDQGAAGTYNILTAPVGSDGYIKLQSSTPGTAQTGSFNISGSGIANEFLTGTLDANTGVDLNIGGTSADSVIIGRTGIVTQIQGTANVNTLRTGDLDTAGGFTLGIGGVNATSVSIGRTGITTYVQDTLNTETVQTANLDRAVAGTLNIGTSAATTINIAGAGVGTYFGGLINAPSIETASIDRSTAGTITFGNANATTISIGTNNAGHTINIGTGTGTQAVTIGSQSGSSSTVIQAGTGGMGFYVPSSAGFGFYQNGNNVFELDYNGRATFKPSSDDISAFKIQNAAGTQTLFRVDSQNGGVLASYLTSTYGITTPHLTFDVGNAGTTYISPNGSSIGTRINIPNADPGAYGQIIALGLPSSANTSARGITVLDARTSSHHPTIAVMSPGEDQVGGLSWDGSNTDFSVKTSNNAVTLKNSTGMGLRLYHATGGGASFQITELGGENSQNGALQLNNATNTNAASLTATSVSTSYVTNLPTAIGTAGQCVSVSSVSGVTQQLGYSDCLTTGTGVQLQASTPGTQQTGNLSISGTGIFGTALQAPSLDTASAGTLSIGTTNATAINIGTNNSGHTISIGSGTGTQTVTIGSTSGSSALNLQGGSGGVNVGATGSTTSASTVNIANSSDVASAQTVNIGSTANASSATNISGSTTTINAGPGGINLNTYSSSASIVAKSNTNSYTAFQIQNATGTALMNADTISGNITINQGPLNVLGVANPSAPTLTSTGSGGSLAASTYYYKLAAQGNSGMYTTAIAASPSSVTTTGSASRNTLSWSAVTGATGYIVYRSTNGTTWFSNTIAAGTTSLVDNGSTYTWSTSATPQTYNATGSVALQQDTVLRLDGGSGNYLASLGYSSFYNQLQLSNYNTSGAIVMTADSFMFQDTTGYNANFSISNTGAVSLKNRSNSSSAFRIQDAGSTNVFNVDTSTSTITLGSSASGNYITFTAAGGLTAYGTSQHSKSIVLAPEYTNAVLDAASDSSCSSANNGTLSSAYDATNYRNYYNWTSTQGTNQCYDVVVDVVLPNDFSSWASSDPINLQALASNTSNAGYAIAVRNVTGAAWDGNYGSAYASPGSISTSWTDVASSSFSGTYNAGDRLSIKIRMTAKSSANLQLGNLTLNYNSKW